MAPDDVIKVNDDIMPNDVIMTLMATDDDVIIYYLREHHY